jgi:hypothetical protein
MNSFFKKNYPVVLSIALFVAISLIYCFPILQGKSLMAGDIVQASAMQQEIMYYKQDGVGPLWTNSMFGGMPSYQIWVQYPSNIASYMIEFWNKIFPFPINILMLYMVCGYVAFRILRYRHLIAFMGAIALAFVSYNFIIVEAGHTGKALAIAFFAPLLASVIIAFKGEKLKGASLLALFLALEIRSNHLQMTYYLMITILVLVIAQLINAIKNKELPNFIKTGFMLVVGAIIGIGINFGSLWVNYEYAEESIRGKSDIQVPSNGLESKGLGKDYAYAWSEGIGESVTFLIPDAYGGASGLPFSNKSEVYSLLIKNGLPPADAIEFAANLGGAARYWGDKPFTSGPYYFGAVTILLFLMGLYFVKGPVKWALVSVTVLSIMLSWGRNFQDFSDLFFDYFPLYSKFRAVESILVIAGLAIPILAIIFLKQLEDDRFDRKELNKRLKYIVLGLGGFLSLFALVPSLFLSFYSPNDSGLLVQLKEMAGPQLGNDIMMAIVDDRISIARMDAIRSLVFIIIGVCLIWAFVNDKLRIEKVLPLLLFLLLVDMWTVNKRYFNDSDFKNKRTFAQSQQPSAVDVAISKDKDIYYRVYDLTSQNPFSSANASKFHKSIGGYHAAKLKRYQNFVDSQLVMGNPYAYNMLNAKYLIVSDEKGNVKTIQNDEALGNAWFVQNVMLVDNANQELMAIAEVNPKYTAIIGADFKSMVDVNKVPSDTTATIQLTSYHPEKMVYEYNSSTNQVAVFSDIYYDKGWNAYVDNQPYPYFRTNFLLRGMQLESGKHIIEFRFEPKAYYMGEKVSLICSILLVLGFVGVLYLNYTKRNV